MLETQEMRQIGFFDGISSLFAGLRFVVGRPRNWGYAAVPTVVASVLTGTLGAAGIALGNELAGRLIDPAASGVVAVGLWALRTVFAVVSLLVAFLVALALAQPISGFALDELSRRQERALGEPGDWPAMPGAFFRTLRVTFVGLLFAIPVLGLLTLATLLIPPIAVVTVPLKFYASALVLAWDFLDYPLGLRGHGVRARITFVRKHFLAVSGLGIAAGCILLLPGVGLFLLPIGVTGAARLVTRAFSQSSQEPAEA
jgi:CysZ protein